MSTSQQPPTISEHGVAPSTMQLYPKTPDGATDSDDEDDEDEDDDNKDDDDSDASFESDASNSQQMSFEFADDRSDEYEHDDDTRRPGCIAMQNIYHLETTRLCHTHNNNDHPTTPDYTNDDTLSHAFHIIDDISTDEEDIPLVYRDYYSDYDHSTTTYHDDFLNRHRQYDGTFSKKCISKYEYHNNPTAFVSLRINPAFEVDKRHIFPWHFDALFDAVIHHHNYYFKLLLVQYEKIHHGALPCDGAGVLLFDGAARAQQQQTQGGDMSYFKSSLFYHCLAHNNYQAFFILLDFISQRSDVVVGGSGLAVEFIHAILQYFVDFETCGITSGGSGEDDESDDDEDGGSTDDDDEPVVPTTSQQSQMQPQQGTNESVMSAGTTTTHHTMDHITTSIAPIEYQNETPQPLPQQPSGTEEGSKPQPALITSRAAFINKIFSVCPPYPAKKQPISPFLRSILCKQLKPYVTYVQEHRCSTRHHITE